MNAKTFLKQLEKLDTIINNKMIERTQWLEIALGVTAHSEGERVQSSGSQQKMADAVDRCVDMEREIDDLIDRLIDLKRDVTSVIEQLPVAEYDVLHKLYIQHMTLYDVAEAKGKTYSWVTSIHGRALKNVQNILDERSEMQLL